MTITIPPWIRSKLEAGAALTIAAAKTVLAKHKLDAFVAAFDVVVIALASPAEKLLVAAAIAATSVLMVKLYTTIRPSSPNTL